MEKVEANLPTVPTAPIMVNGRYWLNALPITPQALSDGVFTLGNVQLLLQVEG